ncbi:MAG: hypothetical protein CVU41_00765 [Chloroflexi bacterium HGW-Chloroflexi-3]|nr:MAG: hypothetical protein CVU41_00765 [Chloroflexi bacterium HGW-Chloroflexi-3]
MSHAIDSGCVHLTGWKICGQFSSTHKRERSKKISNLFLHEVETGKELVFTTGDQNDSSPKWSPDGKTIAFLSNRDNEKQPQIYLIPLNGGEAQKLTNLDGEFLSFSWSPDGKNFICEFRKKNPDTLEREKKMNLKTSWVSFRDR